VAFVLGRGNPLCPRAWGSFGWLRRGRGSWHPKISGDSRLSAGGHETPVMYRGTLTISWRSYGRLSLDTTGSSTSCDPILG